MSSNQCLSASLMGITLFVGQMAQGAPSIQDALSPTPVQDGIEYDTPDESTFDQCTIKAEKINGTTAWIVRGPEGNTLRQFADVNADNVVDTWSYFLDGLEVYRDIDGDNNGKADQHRWFHGAGTRWGINSDEDKQGTIDRWKMISAEEVAEELVAAIRTSDSHRFAALLLSDEEISELGLSDAESERLEQRVVKAKQGFKKLVADKLLQGDSQFTDFGGLKPGIVPAGTRGSTKDLYAYESVWAMVLNGNEHQQLQLGTMINHRGAWKLTASPVLGTAQEVASGIYWNSGGGAGVASALPTGSAPTERMQEILAKLEEIDKEIVSAEKNDRNELNTSRAKLLAELAKVAPNQNEREQWLKQLADMVSAAAQDGSYPEGIAYLKKWEQKLDEDGEKNLLGYFQFQRMLAEYYGVTLAQENVDAAKAHGNWLKSLEAFLDEHPESEHGAEALRQLAMASEISGENEEAVKWYRRLLKDFSSSVHVDMARGAITRLTSEGREIRLVGKALDGSPIDLSKSRGKAVVLQYWTTSCDVCTSDHAILGELFKKYGNGRGLEVIGVNLDYTRDKLVEYLREKRLPWKQMWEQGGFDSGLARNMGVVTVPLMVLVGPDGKVVSSNIRAEEIEGEMKKMIQSRAQTPKKQLTR